MVKNTERFTDTFYYDLELTTKFLRLFSVEFFKKLNTKLSQDEYVTIETILCNAGICQRDLAKIILKDRANTGKLLDSLERKGYITRQLSIKNNRPVKIVSITEAGVNKAEEVTGKIRPHMEVVKSRIDNSDIARVGDLLKELRNVLDETLEIQI